MNDKEKRVQIALGTLDIPECIPIDLRKTNKNDNTHPDLKEEEQYLIYVDGEYQVGFIDPDNNDIFCAGSYEHNISECDAIWLIKKRTDHDL
ncbi:hypothetical protein LCGC14_0882650 [marine sediment metagenome]|uniref:Uncharacterized protein n=1 Tax=marine sediment metagenome TaxID=412755 RepID=A0A0F9PM09_9ZZZZ